MTSRVILCGGTGTLGRPIADALRGRGATVGLVTRRPKQVNWQGPVYGWDQLPAAIEKADAVINLAGKPVATRWTSENRRAIATSRVEAAEAVGDAIRRASVPPRRWLQASAVGIYGDAGEQVLGEDAQTPGEGFLASVCEAWEQAASRAAIDTADRLTILRIGVVLQPDGGPWQAMTKAARLGLGGRVGSGRQWVPWIDGRDLTRAVLFLLDHELAGVVNLASPNPVRNAELMSHVRRRAGRSFGLPAPALPMRLAQKHLGLPAEAVLFGQRVQPVRLLNAGFTFNHAELSENVPASD